MTYQYPMERVFYNIHEQTCTSALRKTSNRSRSVTEHLLLVVAVCGFGVLLLVHISFVYSGGKPRADSKSSLRNIPLTCLPSVAGFSTEADLTHISLTEQKESHAFFKAESCDTTQSCSQRDVTQEEILVSHSLVKGYLLLPPTIAQRSGLRILHVVVSKSDFRCFGEPFLQKIIFSITGPDTAVLNWLLAVYDGKGYVYEPRSMMLQDLKEQGTFLRTFESDEAFDRSWERRDAHNSLNKQALAKIGVVLKTSFLFFITSTLVSFTLRETQERMLDFTHQLQAMVRSGLPVQNLVTTHLADSLVFCPVMVGMIFFLIEFYRGDKVMAFIILSVVWLCEVFSVISLRSWQGINYFPKIFFLLFSVLHFYIFSFPFGFRHTAMVSTFCFMVHSMFFFWHRFELPAVALGQVTSDHPRMRGMSPIQHHEPTDQRSVATGISNVPPIDRLAHANSNNGTSTRDSGNERGIRMPQVQLQPRTRRNARQHSHSLDTTPAYGRLATRPSSTLLVEDGTHSASSDTEGSYLFFMNGEVVMPAMPQTPTSGGGSLSVTSSLPSCTALENHTRSSPIIARGVTRAMENSTDSADTPVADLGGRPSISDDAATVRTQLPPSMGSASDACDASHRRPDGSQNRSGNPTARITLTTSVPRLEVTPRSENLSAQFAEESKLDDEARRA